MQRCLRVQRNMKEKADILYFIRIITFCSSERKKGEHPSIGLPCLPSRLIPAAASLLHFPGVIHSFEQQSSEPFFKEGCCRRMPLWGHGSAFGGLPGTTWTSLRVASGQTPEWDSVWLLQQNHCKPINRLETREWPVAKEQAPRGKQLLVWAGAAM